MAYLLINASTAEARKVKDERIALQHILSFDLYGLGSRNKLFHLVYE